MARVSVQHAWRGLLAGGRWWRQGRGIGQAQNWLLPRHQQPSKGCKPRRWELRLVSVLIAIMKQQILQSPDCSARHSIPGLLRVIPFHHHDPAKVGSSSHFTGRVTEAEGAKKTCHQVPGKPGFEPREAGSRAQANFPAKGKKVCRTHGGPGPLWRARGGHGGDRPVGKARIWNCPGCETPSKGKLRKRTLGGPSELKGNCWASGWPFILLTEAAGGLHCSTESWKRSRPGLRPPARHSTGTRWRCQHPAVGRAAAFAHALTHQR